MKVLLTGAAGGIGREVAIRLAEQGAELALADRNADALQQLADEIVATGGRAQAVSVDLLDGEQRRALPARVETALGPIDTLVNLAGLLSFSPFEHEDPAAMERLVKLNLLVPMDLTRTLLPGMIERGSGHIVNVGSTFGSIGFAYFAAYSASKFGLRGFSEALRRELRETGVKVTYVAPRAVRTPLNTAAIYRMAKAVKMNMDSPERVAEEIAAAILKPAKDAYIGFPESLFVRINAILPRLVDGALRRQNRVMATFAREHDETGTRN
ncbi:MAG: SDR family oxidoreductase [Gammaproteobacteria bacterium]|nr:SDR family oxidoreductase [Gammaproteobacteria bacterium]MCP5136181.1 SDR family oxidoreductase [Gammaproteobacteria bacterium]